MTINSGEEIGSTPQGSRVVGILQQIAELNDAEASSLWAAWIAIRPPASATAPLESPPEVPNARPLAEARTWRESFRHLPKRTQLSQFDSVEEGDFDEVGDAYLDDEYKALMRDIPLQVEVAFVSLAYRHPMTIVAAGGALLFGVWQLGAATVHYFH